MLITHSMGSIIAYDTLMYLAPKIPIDTFVSLGSPLGNSVIIKKILIEKYGKIPKQKKAQTPNNVRTAWYNFADINDKITLNYDLADDFVENANIVKPIDILVENHYKYEEQRNPHKVYGYLQATEVSKVIAAFLES